VEAVAFSFSKLWALGHARIGVEYSPPQTAGSIGILSGWDYGPKLSAYLAFELMGKIPFDLPRAHFRDKQKQICAGLGLEPSDCYLFGISQSPLWDDFLRDKTYRRACLSPLLLRA